MKNLIIDILDRGIATLKEILAQLRAATLQPQKFQSLFGAFAQNTEQVLMVFANPAIKIHNSDKFIGGGEKWILMWAYAKLTDVNQSKYINFTNPITMTADGQEINRDTIEKTMGNYEQLYSHVINVTVKINVSMNEAVAAFQSGNNSLACSHFGDTIAAIEELQTLFKNYYEVPEKNILN